jgi:hypothetical protein
MPLIARCLFGDVDDSAQAALMLAFAGAAVSLSSQASAAGSSADRRTADRVTANTPYQERGPVTALAFKNQRE